MRTKVIGLMAVSLVAIALLPGAAVAQDGDDPTPADRWFQVRYDMSVSQQLTELELEGEVLLHEQEAPDAQARQICGETCTADEARDAYQDRPRFRDRIVAMIEDAVEDRTRAALMGVSGASQSEVDVTATVDRASLEQPTSGSPFLPAVPVAVTGTAPIGLVEGTGYSQDQIDALFRMGARAHMPVDPDVDPGVNLTLSLSVPEPLAMLPTEGDDRTQEWGISNWKAPEGSVASLDANATIGRPDVVVPDRERLDVDVVLDLSSVDVHYLQALTGGTPASVDAVLSVDATIRSIAAPTQVPQITLDYLSADAIRIGRANGLVEDSQLATFEDEARAAIRQGFQETTGEQTPVSGGFVPSTLETSQIGEPVGTGGPIVLDMSAEGTMPLPPEQGSTGAAAFEVTRMDLGSFQLPAIPTPGDRPANVTVILPPGLDLAFDSVENGEVTRSTTSDGSTALTFTSASSGQPATLQGAEIVVNHPIVWDLLWPVLLFLFLILVVLPGAIIWAVIRKRRRETRGVNEEQRSPVRGGYADEHRADPDGDEEAEEEGIAKTPHARQEGSGGS